MAGGETINILRYSRGETFPCLAATCSSGAGHDGGGGAVQNPETDGRDPAKAKQQLQTRGLILELRTTITFKIFRHIFNRCLS